MGRRFLGIQTVISGETYFLRMVYGVILRLMRLKCLSVLRRYFADQALPAMLVSGDVGPATRELARSVGLHLLDKPVQPMTLRALASRLMADSPAATCATPTP